MAIRRFHCKCGASFTYQGNTPPHVLAILKADHVGPGHGECDAKTATKARAASERREAITDGRAQPWER